jgi:curved DNA-binding protein CbpA
VHERAKRSSQPPSPQAVSEHRDLLLQARERLASQDHFQVLELGRKASTDQVRDAYLRLAKLYHPDRCAALGLLDLSPVAEEIFRRVNEAHAVLIDPEARQRYEEQLDGGGGQKAAMQALEAEFAFQKGLVFFRKKNFAEAQRCFEEACRLNDKEGEHLAWLAWTRYQNPKVDNATALPHIRDQLLRAVKISPQNATCHYYLGEIYLALSDEKRAHACFARTVELQESHVDANRHLRLMQMRKERREKKERGLFGGLLKKK